MPPINRGLCTSTPVSTSSILGVLFDPREGCDGKRVEVAQGFFGGEVDCVVLADTSVAWTPVEVEAGVGRGFEPREETVVEED